MSQQIYYVSRQHAQSVKVLYKLIFKLHKSLPEELRQIGNGYVRTEFKLHKSATPDQAKTFLAEWAVSISVVSLYIAFILLGYNFKNYAQTLMRQLHPKNRGARLGLNLEDKIESFNEGQVLQLYELFQETKKPLTNDN